jgi:hypothetical protein
LLGVGSLSFWIFFKKKNFFPFSFPNIFLLVGKIQASFLPFSFPYKTSIHSPSLFLPLYP